MGGHRTPTTGKTGGDTWPGPARPEVVLQGILFVLFTGIGWDDLPQELGFGSGMTCWRRPRGTGKPPGCSRRCTRLSWTAATPPGLIDFDRAKTGSKHHLLTCGNGFPLVVELSARPTSTTT